MKSTRRSQAAASQQSSDHQPRATGGGGRSNAELQERMRRKQRSPQSVSDANGLRKALSKAGPGDWLRLEDGVYDGEFRMRGVQGTQEAPLRIEGSSKAVLDGGKGKTTLQLEASDHVELAGFTILGGQRGLILSGCDHNLMDGLTVKNTLSEAVHFKESSSFNTLQNSHINDAGRGSQKQLGNGEGVYIGSDSKKWGDKGGQDRSDHNNVLNNYIEGTSSESVDVKEGTKGTRIEGNVMVGDRIAGVNGAWSLVDLKGSHSTVKNNTFLNPSGNGKVKNGWEVTRRPWKGNKKSGGDSGMHNVLEDNRYQGIKGGGSLHNQTSDGKSWEKTTSGAEKVGSKNRAEHISAAEWHQGKGRSPSQAPGNNSGGASSSAQTDHSDWRKAMGRWEPARTTQRTRLFEAPGKPGRTLEQGEPLWVRDDSQDDVQLDNAVRPSWRVMVDEDGKGSDDKGRVKAEALPSRYQSATQGTGKEDARDTDKGGLDSIQAPSDAGKKNKQFPAGIADMLLKKTGLDSEQWDNIADLIGKSEHNMGKGWASDPGKFYGSCEELEYDKDTRGTTITAFGATTGKGYNDAKRLFKEYGTSAEDLGLGNFQRFKKNIHNLRDNPKWQQAVWRWFHSEYVAPSVSALEGLGFTSALTVAAVTDCALNQGFTGKHGAKTLMGMVGRARSEKAFLRRFLDERAKVADKNSYNENGNGARRVGMYRKLLDQGQLDLRDKDRVRDAMSWKMH